MSTIIKGGTGKGYSVKVSSDNKLKTDAITEPLSAERSRSGRLYGIGTGNLTLDASMSLSPVLYLKNNSKTDDMYIQKIIFGWNGGSTNHDRTVLSFIKYQESVPTGANTEINDAIENISLSGSSEGVSSGLVTGHKWDGSGSAGMTGQSSGYLQIPNRIAKGNTSISIDGEIILGPGDTMTFRATPEEAGEFHVSVVYYFVPTNEERGDS